MSEASIIAAAIEKGFGLPAAEAETEAVRLLDFMCEAREKKWPLLRQNNDKSSRNDFDYISSFEEIVKACEEGCWVGYKTSIVAHPFFVKRSS